MRHVESGVPQLDIEARELLETELDEANVGDLRAEVEVDQLDDVEPARRLELVDRLHELRGVEPELRLLAAALLPPAEAARRELDAHARLGRDAHLVGDLQQHVDLAELLDDDVDLMPELLAHEGEAHELLVLVAVADEQVVGVLGEAENGLELRLAPALEADLMLLPELDDL